MTTEKLCPKCEITKSADDFYRVATRADGLSGYCRTCQLADAKNRHVPSQRWKAPEGMKKCPKCDSIKALDDFGNNRTTHDGKQQYCKPCSVASVTASRHKDPTSHRASSKAWREKNIERHADNNARWKYGIEHGTYDQMFSSQNGVCAICGDAHETERRLHVDHCHTTNKVRGLLCNSCNNGLGRFKDDPVKLRAAADYVEKHST